MDTVKTEVNKKLRYGLYSSSAVVIAFIIVFLAAGYNSEAEQTPNRIEELSSSNEAIKPSTNFPSNKLLENVSTNDTSIKNTYSEEEEVTKNKVDTVNLEMKPPEGYQRTESFSGDCSVLQQGFSCINFEDNFILVVNDKPTISKEPEQINGYETIKIFGKKTNYYHILNTDLIRTEEVNHDTDKTVNIDIYSKNFELIEKGTPMSLFPGYVKLAQLSADPYEGLKNIQTSFMYSYFMIGNDTDNIISIAVDKKEGYSKVYIDKNNDQDVFNDGSPVTVSKKSIACGIKLPLKISGERNIKGIYNICMQEIDKNLSYFPMNYYYGNININGSSYKSVALEQSQFDKNFDGLFYNSGLWIDINQNGRFEEEEHYSDGDILPVDNNDSYKVSLNYP